MTQRVVTGTPVNLKERIAALQQRAASASPQSTSPFSASPSAQASLALPTGVASTSSVSALRERIARFEGKGGVPVPRGSFGLGAPQTRDGSVGRKRGELYGNRITSGGRDSPSSPPSSLSRLGVAGRDFNGDSQRSFSTNESGVGNGSSVRKRCISTSVLEGFTNGSPRSRAFPSDATSDTANESEGAEAESLSTELNAADSLHVSTRLTRRNSISSADALRSAIPKDRDSPPNETPEDAHSPPLRSLEPAVLQDVSEEGDVPETQTSILGLDVGESLPKNTLVESDDTLGIAAARQDTTDGVDEQQQELILEKVQEQQVLEDVADEDSAKTPVVSSFTASSIAMSHIYDEPATTDGQEIVIVSDDSALSDIATPNTGSLSPLTASLEIGERVFHETQKYVVVAPLGSAEAPVTIVLEGDVAPSSASTGNMGGVQSSSHLSEPEAKAETGETSEGRPEMPKIDIPLHSAPHVATSPSSATTTGSARRRHPPSPIPIIRDEHYVEPSLELKTGPKSFRAVVHGKKTQIPTVPLPRAMPSLLDAQVITVHQRAIGRVGPDSPGSPDLSALVAQALNLEQQLMGGESETLSTKSTSPDFASSNDSVTDSGMSQTSQVCFPRSPGVHKALSVSGDAVPPTPPPKSPHMNALVRDRESSRTSWSWSSEQASSEDSASVTTPPLSEGSEQVHDHTHPHIPAQGLSVEPPDEYEGRHSISSILSSPGRSARKKVLSMSRPTSVLGRMLSRSGRSSSTLALPDDNASIHTCDYESFSINFPTSVSAFSSFSETLARPSSPNGAPSLSIPLSFPVSMFDDHSDEPRRLSVLSASTASVFSANSTLDQELFDAFPAVPSAIPGQGPSSLGPKPVRAQEEDRPGTPLPPKLSSKSSKSSFSHAFPPSSFSFPSFGSEPDCSPVGSWSAKSRPKPPILSLPSDSNSPAPQSSTGSSIFSSISRSLSGRSRTRVSSSSSINSKHLRMAF